MNVIQKERTNLPLCGVKVIEFGQYIAGPAVGMMLGDLGATVVHIDPPFGPMWDNPANATLSRNKLVVQVDLKTEEGLSQAQALIAQADIVVENFRPGVLARLGINLGALREARPELITVSIPGFASNDELRREWRAFEAVVAASSGLFTDMAINRVLMGASPYFSPLPLASAYGAMFAVSAAVLALQAREHSGVGDHIEVPLACAVMEGLTFNTYNIERLPSRYKSRLGLEIARRRRAQMPMNLSYQSLQELRHPLYRTYKCKDGRGFSIACVGHKHHSRRCLQILGLYDELLAEGLAEGDAWLPEYQWPSEALLGALELPKEWSDKIAERMQAVFLTRTAQEWERNFGEGRAPGAAQRWLQEWLKDEHTISAGLVVKVDDPEYGVMAQPGPVVWMEESGETTAAPAPRKSATFEDALASLTAIVPIRPLIRPVRKSTGWLDGVRILDLSNVIAGPISTSYLARFGAEVIKLDPVKPLYGPFVIPSATVTLRGKNSVLVDIVSSAGRDVFERIVKSVDVVVWNAVDRQVERMGLDPEGLKELNPDAIFCKIDCFGGVRPGPLSGHLGYDDLVQVTSGIMLRFGGSMETPEEHAHIGTIDLLGGYAAALGIAAALYDKARTGHIGRPRTSLSALSGLLQVPFWYDYEGRGPFDEPSGINARGYDALIHLYEAGCGRTLLLSACERDLPRLAGLEGLEGLAEVPKDQRASFLATAFRTASGEQWLFKLHAANIGAAMCDTLESLRMENTRLADGSPGTEQGSYSFSKVVDHPIGCAVTQVDQFAVRPAVGNVYTLSPAEKFGASTRHVLRGLRYTEAEIDALIRVGAISESWSSEYLPG